MSELPDELKFKAEDFQSVSGLKILSQAHAAKIANALLSQRLGEVMEVIQADPCEFYWVEDRLISDKTGTKRRALLVCVKEVKQL